MALSQELKDLDRHIDELTFGASELEAAPGPMPSPDEMSIHRILVAVDGSEGADRALAWAEALGKRFDAPVHAVAVLSLPEHERYFGNFLGKPYNKNILDSEKREGEEVVADAVMRLENAGVEADSLLAAGWPAQEIAKAANEVEADLVIVGARRGLGAHLPVGSVADRVKELTEAHVLVAKGEPRDGPVLAATDGSTASKRAAAMGLRVARELEADAVMLHVAMVPVFGDQDAVSRHFDDDLEAKERSWNDAGVDYVVRFGDVAETIASEARDREAQLVVVGARGLGSVPGQGLGGVANRVAHDADAPVLLVKGAQ